MYTVSYYKIAGRWYLDASGYADAGVKEEHLESIGAFHDFLELAADGGSTVVFHMDAKPFDGADRFDFVDSSGGDSGGYYYIGSFRGQQVDLELWFNTMIYIGRTAMPKTIYFRRVTPP